MIACVFGGRAEEDPLERIMTEGGIDEEREARGKYEVDGEAEDKRSEAKLMKAEGYLWLRLVRRKAFLARR